MVFKKIVSVQPPAEHLAKAIARHLKNGEDVLWLVAGGSSVEVAVQTAKLLEGVPLKNLAVILTDERYGPIGHQDSNWYQLLKAGLSLPGAHLKPVLDGEPIAVATQNYARRLQEAMQTADYKIGLFGLGPDGHTAGILPGSQAIDSDDWATSYQGPDFMRITSTAKAIAGLDEAVVYAVGGGKKQALDDLEKDLPVDIQPAQALKQVKLATVYNDYKGESL